MIIGITGKARSGKDTVGEYICKYWPFERFAFADRMKEIIKDIFRWDERHVNGVLKEVDDPFWQCSPRKAMQIFGTEFGRRVNENMWVMMAAREINARGTNVVITDVRFENEADFVRSNGVLIHVVRPLLKTNVRAHASEAGVNRHKDDILIINNGTLNELYREVDDRMSDPDIDVPMRDDKVVGIVYPGGSNEI